MATMSEHTFSSGITADVTRVGWPAIRGWIAGWERANPSPVAPIQIVDEIEIENTLHPDYVAAKVAWETLKNEVINDHGLYMALRPHVDEAVIAAAVGDIRARNERSPWPQELSASDLIVYLKHVVLLTPEDFYDALQMLDGRKVSGEGIEAAKAAMFSNDVQGPEHLEAPGVAE